MRSEQATTTRPHEQATTTRPRGLPATNRPPQQGPRTGPQQQAPLQARLQKAQAPADPLALPAFATLRALRRELSRGGMPAENERTAEDQARIALFVVVSDVLRVLEDFRARVQRGEAVRLRTRPIDNTEGRARFDVTIEPVTIEPVAPAASKGGP